MKIKEKMVELKNRGVDFVKEHKDEIIVAGMVFAAEMTFYCIGRRDGKIERVTHMMIITDPETGK